MTLLPRTGPLSARDMVYTISNVTEGPKTTYGYASVSDAWVTDTLEGGGAIKSTGKVRSFNIFPTCDRVTILPGGKGECWALRSNASTSAWP